MFFVTAHMVKPVNGDDLPNMRGIDGLKGNSPLALNLRVKASPARLVTRFLGQNGEAPVNASLDSGYSGQVEEPKNKAAEPTKAKPAPRISSTRNTNRSTGRESGTRRLQSGISTTLVTVCGMDFRSQPKGEAHE